MKDKLTFFTSLQFLSKYIKKHKKNFFMFYFGWLFDSVISVILPILFGIMIDEIIYKQNMQTFLSISLVIGVISIFSCLLYFFIYAQHHYLMNMYTFDIKKEVFEHYLKMESKHLFDINTGETIACMQFYPSECMHFVIRGVIHQINRMIMMVLIIICVFRIHAIMGGLVLMMALLSAIISKIFGTKIRAASNKQRELYGNYVGWLYEILSGLRDLRILNATNVIAQKFGNRHMDIFKQKNKATVTTVASQSIISFTNVITQLLIFTFAAYLAYEGNITIGILTVILEYYSFLKRMILELNSSWLDAQGRVAYIQKIYDFLNLSTEENWMGKNKLEIKVGTIRFENVSFSYTESETYVLDKFSLTIKAGEKFALVGKSGCGKTTVANLITALLTVDSGTILIDGINLSQCSLKSIRHNIGIINQDVLIFDGTIRDNILLGNKKALKDEVIDACQKAGIWKYIESLELGIDTIIGTRGIGLSGGQKQRIAIARIYLKSPKIIIFDEATSALDHHTEQEILREWKEVLTGRTAIVIAHRQSSVMMCDRAAVMEKGRIIAIGEPMELERSSHTFRNIFGMKELERGIYD